MRGNKERKKENVQMITVEGRGDKKREDMKKRRKGKEEEREERGRKVRQ